ncbi:MAG TPA: response regulator transcription factor [Ideonella sp.]|uniref:response regulator transcription factor n=1 Tax=Ideonella sp. TaxID=1929293 RepID=UPI002E35A910|nr:response regulator transcription factor [Ideonella sp.]HEX5687392.1 response regulator transcription factor [Ideonella sp.]
MGPTRVLLVEDHRLVREALRDVLSRLPDIEVVGEAGDAADALAQSVRLMPDVIVLDIGLPDLSGIDLTLRLKRDGSKAKIVALSAYSDRRFVMEMVRAGAAAYVAKSAAGTELVRAISSVAAGHHYFCPEVSSLLAAGLRGGIEPAPPLGRRERDVLRLVAQGQRTSAIADQLHISASTVEVHRRNIMRKLDLHTVADLTRYAIREGLAGP